MKYLKKHFCLAVCLAGLAVSSNANDSQLKTDCIALTKHPHRLSGTVEYKAAADYVERRLQEIGMDELIVQEFPTAQTKVKRCEAVDQSGNPLFQLLPVRPNGIIPPTTPSNGITGELIYVGKGTAEDFEQADPRGKIAVMDYNCEVNWQRAFRLGAKAIIFAVNSEAESRHHHYARANANLPRFFFDGDHTKLANGLQITIHSEIIWERVSGRNIIGFLKGSNPVFALERDEVIIVSANLDTFGEIPRKTPGARPAANCATLLKLAADLKLNRPRRDVLFLFLDAQARSHAGSIAFYWALEEKTTKATSESQLISWKEETAFLADIDELTQKGEIFGKQDIHKSLTRRLKAKAKKHAFAIRADLMTLREERAEENKKEDKNTTRIKELLAAENQLKPIQDRWNELRRALGKGELTAEVEGIHNQILSEVQADIALRQNELSKQEKVLNSWEKLRNLLKDRWISLHISLILGDTTDRWGIIVGGDSEFRSSQDKPGLYGKVQRSFLQAYESLAGKQRNPLHFEVGSADGSFQQTRLLWAAPHLIHGGEIAGRKGIYNIVIGTMHEKLPREGTPDDTLKKLDLEVIERNSSEIGLLLAAIADLDTKYGEMTAVADQEGLSLRRAIAIDNDYITPSFTKGRTQGALAMGRQHGSSMPDMPMAGATVQISLTAPWNKIYWTHSKAYAFDQFQVVVTDQNGAYHVGALPKTDPDPIGFAALFDDRGQAIMCSDSESKSTVRRRLNMFRCHGGTLMLPPRYWSEDATVLDARANSPISYAGSEKSFTEVTDSIAYWYCEEKVENIKLFGLASIVALVNDEKALQQKQNSYGIGYPMTSEWMTLDTTRQSAWDIWRLNEQRLDILRSRDIMNSSIEEAHGRIADMLKEADASDSIIKREALAASAFMNAAPIYHLIRSSMDDLVKAVLILLALCVPFAFALERLLVGSTMIYKQMTWFVLFFILTFLILFFSHPAFAIAKTPIIIFLGFAVIVLSSLVITIIMQKFEIELKAFQGMTSTVHASDISRFNTILAAMAMGISTMRRRPLRTTLTAITIILLTFTILCFASFDTQKGIVKLFTGPPPTYSGVMLRNPNRGSYNNEFIDVVSARWGEEASVTPRYWICPEFQDDPDIVVARGDGTKPVQIKGILGIEPNEVRHRPDLAKLFRLKDPADLEKTALMTEAVAKLLEVNPGDNIILKGNRYVVGELLKASALGAARDMDGASILPVDFAQMQAAQSGDKQLSEDALDQQETWASLPVDSILILSARNTHISGGKPHLLSIYTDDAERAATIAESCARMLDKFPITATRNDGVYRHILGTVVAASGVGDLFFPVLLGGLVIFGTMLGSVADREKEIYTFSALGLAPPHVASLFFAEAMVYSVIGGLGGYLIAQGSMKILGIAAKFGWAQVPEMNYSSTNAIVTILIVMATVLISAIYPAVKASRSANPGLLRAWKLPQPNGDIFDIVFPFTVSEYDLTGVVSFLKEHFDNYSDSGIGCFMAKNAELVKLSDGNLGVNALLALAPFDLGVTQSFSLTSAPSEIEGIDQVNIKLERKSGQPKDWERLNRILLDDLRTQFLLWRSLPEETMEIYRQRTLTKQTSNTITQQKTNG